MSSDSRINPKSMIGKVFRKRDAKREERIRFVSTTEFWHRFVDQEDDGWGDPDPQTYRMRGDGHFELDWGGGAVFLCQFLESSSQFLELNPRSIFYWELYSEDRYSDRGSTSA